VFIYIYTHTLSLLHTHTKEAQPPTYPPSNQQPQQKQRFLDGVDTHTYTHTSQYSLSHTLTPQGTQSPTYSQKTKQRFLDGVDVGISATGPDSEGMALKKQLAQHMAEEHLSVGRASQVGVIWIRVLCVYIKGEKGRGWWGGVRLVVRACICLCASMYIYMYLYTSQTHRPTTQQQQQQQRQTYLERQRRYNYVTPRSFLELIGFYKV
jgi:hypothetical protein